MTVLLFTAFTLAFVHTVVGPDHYLPFILIGRSKKWSLQRTIGWALLCGMGHVSSSIILGGFGIALGWSLSSMEWFDLIRGDMAAYSLIIFGGIYMSWGIITNIYNKDHTHIHVHNDEIIHRHGHHHSVDVKNEQIHQGQKHGHGHSKTFWTIFLIFVLGPCEPLIPLLMVPATKHNIGGIILVSGVFAITTLITMVACVTIGFWGLKMVKLDFLEKHVHSLSGAAIVISGVLIKFLGL